MQRFEAEILEADRGGAFIAVPPSVVEAIGGAGRIKVQATFDGVPYQGSVVSMGGQKIIGILKAIRTELGKEPGDTIAVTLDIDRSERSVTAPDDLRAALDRAGLGERFAALSYSHQRESVQWVEEAKRPETRLRRIAQTVDRLGG